ncbi:Cupredoxin [Pseudomassariella vexata]|uniref:Cupredoxin n=1 Tax=Pseudomassariella vexata TaxID=1141098 RepID=A0A1Y2DK09_9PEZI|nr:Cupredoxin [Pseudomassariella vexata]ORY59529.1 Cupredoxin [Pseudomassariella vexata]
MPVGAFAGMGSLSTLGTPFAHFLPKFLNNNPLPNGFPWGTRTAQKTNPYLDRPETGVVRHYDWTVSKAKAAPDGVSIDMLLINGQFPGPIIEANWGDWIEVTVHNNISDEGTAFHWHGNLQQETQWMDGVPGVTQCPIAPRSTFTYKFKPDIYGSSWYHAHYESQLASGLIGPMVIYGPQHYDYDIDVGPVMVHDHYHTYYETIEVGVMANPARPTRSDNNLINGKNSFNGNNAPLASFNFTTNKKIRLRLINPSVVAVEKVSIDGHQMTVIANDFVPVQPYQTDVVTLAPGQRTDVVIQGLKDPKGTYWLRAYKSPNCSPSQPNSLEAKAAIFYEKADRTQQPNSQAGVNAYNKYCGNDELTKTVPLFPIAPGQPGYTEVVPIVFRSNGTADLWYLQNRTARVDYNEPELLDAKKGDLNFDYIQNVHNYGTNSSIRFIIENPGAQPHPIHLHGHNIWILQQGACDASKFDPDYLAGDVSARGLPTGADGPGAPRNTVRSSDDKELESREPTLGLLDKLKDLLTGKKGGKDTPTVEKGHCWDGSIVNSQNPQRRDVHMLLPNSYVVLQWNQDNPGHIAWHLSGGFLWMVLENPEAIKKLPIPDVMEDQCQVWMEWTNNHVVDQIGDGI